LCYLKNGGQGFAGKPKSNKMDNMANVLDPTTGVVHQTDGITLHTEPAPHNDVLEWKFKIPPRKGRKTGTKRFWLSSIEGHDDDPLEYEPEAWKAMPKTDKAAERLKAAARIQIKYEYRHTAMLVREEKQQQKNSKKSNSTTSSNTTSATSSRNTTRTTTTTNTTNTTHMKLRDNRASPLPSHTTKLDGRSSNGKKSTTHNKQDQRRSKQDRLTNRMIREYEYAALESGNEFQYLKWYNSVTNKSTKWMTNNAFRKIKDKFKTTLKQVSNRQRNMEINKGMIVRLERTIKGKDYLDRVIKSGETYCERKQYFKNMPGVEKKHGTNHFSDLQSTETRDRVTKQCHVVLKALQYSLKTTTKGCAARPGDFPNLKAAYKQVSADSTYTVSGETVRLWVNEFKRCGGRFLESLKGKYMKGTVFDEFPVVKNVAIEFLKEATTRKDNPFHIQEWMDYVNDEEGLMDSHDIPHYWRLHRADLFDKEGGDRPPSKKPWLTVSLTTAWRWARRLGLSFDAKLKSYYVDGHDFPDVLFFRNKKWLPAEEKAEMRQYHWLVMTKAEAIKAGLAYVEGIQKQVERLATATVEPRVGTIPSEYVEYALEQREQKIKWRVIVAVVKAKIKNDESKKYITRQGLQAACARYKRQEVTELTNDEVSSMSKKLFQGKGVALDTNHEEYKFHESLMKEMVYFFEKDGVEMVEVHVDLLPVWWRDQKGTKLTIRGKKVRIHRLFLYSYHCCNTMLY